MFTLAVAQRASSHRAVGSGRSAGRSSVSKAERRQPSSFLNGPFVQLDQLGDRDVQVVERCTGGLRRHAKIQRCATSTAPRPALSRGLPGRAGTIARS